jgi:hypothetical protein
MLTIGCFLIVEAAAFHSLFGRQACFVSTGSISDRGCRDREHQRPGLSGPGAVATGVVGTVSISDRVGLRALSVPGAVATGVVGTGSVSNRLVNEQREFR